MLNKIFGIVFALFILVFSVVCVTPASTQAMSQPLVSGYNDALNAATTEYNNLYSGEAWGSGTYTNGGIITTPGILKNLYINLTRAPNNGGGTQSYTFNVYVNGLATALTCTISETATTGNNINTEIDLAVGDYVYLVCTPSGTPDTPAAQWSTMFVGSNDSESILMHNAQTGTAHTYYHHLSTGSAGTGTTENNNRVVCPTNGTLKNLYVYQNGAGGSGNTTFTLRVNNASAALTVFIANPSSTGSNTTASVAVVAGDTLDLMSVSVGVTTTTNCMVGWTFVPTIDGESLILGVSNVGANVTAVTYNFMNSPLNSAAWNTNEAGPVELVQACTLKNLYIKHITAPGSGKSFTYTVRNALASTTINCTVSGTGLTANDTVNSASVAVGSKIDLMSTPSGTPTTSVLSWGLVSYIAPYPIVITSGGDSGVTTATLYGAITTIENSNIDRHSFVWGTTHQAAPTGDPSASNPYDSYTTETGNWTTESFSSGIAGLTSGTIYYYRAGARNANSVWGWGIERSFLPTSGMAQVIVGGAGDSLNTSSTEWNALSGGYVMQPVTIVYEAVTQVVSTSGKIKNLKIKLSASPGAGVGDGYRFTLMVNNLATLLTCTVTQPDTTASDTLHEITVVGGDFIKLKAEPLNTPSDTPSASWSSMFYGIAANESLLLGNGGSMNNTVVYYRGICSSGGAHSLEVGAQQVCPTNGTIKNLYIKTSSAAGAAPDQYVFTLRVNGADTALTCTLTGATATTTSNTTATVAVVAGDLLSISSTPTDTPASSVMCYGFTFVSDISGESLWLHGSTDQPSTAASEYIRMVSGATGAEVWSNTETDRYQLAQVCTLRKFYTRLNGAPGVGKSYTFTVRQNAANTSISMVITGAATTGNDLVNTVTLSDYDYVDMMCTPSGTPSGTQVYSSVVCYIAPTYDITNTPDSKAFGAVAENSVYYAKGVAPSNPVGDTNCTYTLTNIGSTSINVYIKSSNFTGGVGWTLDGPGINQVKITAYRSGIDPASGVVVNNTDQELVHELTSSSSKMWDFKLETGTFTDGVIKTANITLTSTVH